MSSKNKGETNRAKLARTTAIFGAVAAAAAAVSGSAHADPAGAPTAGTSSDETIVVTGTRIPQPNLVTTSPVTQVTAADITTQGVTRVEDMVNQLPQAFAAQNATVSNGASGTATIDLRGLGSERTLVLIDGRRMPYGSPNGPAAADLNTIPGPLIDRVEVLTGGASAVYGSDAISGVVNFIMRHDFEGIRLDTQYGFYENHNDDDSGFIRQVIAARHATNPAQFNLPQSDVIDGYSKEATFMIGASTPDHRGNITAYLNYRNNSAILQRNRDYSACTLGAQSTAAVAGVPAGAAHWTCGGSSTSYPGRFLGPFGSKTIDSTTSGTSTAFRNFNASLDQYNFGPLNYYQRPDERYSFGAFGHYEVNEHAEAYTQMMFSDYNSVAQIAPSGDFGNTSVINCGNPLLSPTEAGQIGCSASDITADNKKPFYVLRRNVEGGGRQDHLEYTDFRGVFGVRGALTDTWNYDISATYSRVNESRVYRNDFSVTRLNRALDVVNAGPGVNPECRSFVNGTDKNCVPYNIFTLAGKTGGVNGLIPGGPSAAALAYLEIPLVETGDTTQQDVIGTVTGDFDFGSPWAHDKVAASFGVEYLRNSLELTPDTSFQTGDGAGQGGPTTALNGVTDNFDVFGEAQVPLVQDGAFAKSMSLDLAYRYSSYDTGVHANTFKIGGDWAPIDDIRFRASYQRAVRAANVIELFAAQGTSLFNMTSDPCDFTLAGHASAAACIGPNPWQTNAAATTSGTLSNSAGQYNQLTGGNPNLSPEISDTDTAGFVVQPSFLPGFNVSFDWFDIKIKNLISIVDPGTTVNNCFFGGVASSCALITRNPGNGRLWTGTGVVDAINTNIGGLETSGVDVNANYRRHVGDMGVVTFNLVGTWLDKLKTNQGPGRLTFDCVGDFGGACGTPNPEWRHRFRVGWETPWSVDLSLTWRYYSSVDQTNAAAKPVTGKLDSTLPAENYFDLAGSWHVRENTTMRFGIDNILDKHPPLSIASGSGALLNGNTFPGTYDALGRYVFAGLTVDF
jgi:outer membrane receptor protein involved in Fe transport